VVVIAVKSCIMCAIAIAAGASMVLSAYAAGNLVRYAVSLILISLILYAFIVHAKNTR